MVADFYAILGIAPTTSREEIKPILKLSPVVERTRSPDYKPTPGHG